MFYKPKNISHNDSVLAPVNENILDYKKFKNIIGIEIFATLLDIEGVKCHGVILEVTQDGLIIGGNGDWYAGDTFICFVNGIGYLLTTVIGQMPDAIHLKFTSDEPGEAIRIACLRQLFGWYVYDDGGQKIHHTRRNETRVALNFPLVKCRRENDIEFTAQAIDCSRGGYAICSEENLDIGEPIILAGKSGRVVHENGNVYGICRTEISISSNGKLI